VRALARKLSEVSRGLRRTQPAKSQHFVWFLAKPELSSQVVEPDGYIKMCPLLKF
jgi:hypothetical protein